MKRICLIEHNDQVAQSLSDTLADTGFSVTAFHRDADALKSITAEPPDLLILELFLPDQGSIEMLVSIREAVPGLPVLILVGEPHQLAWSSVAHALRLGANAALQAPFSPEELSNAVARSLEQPSLDSVLC